MIDVVEVARRGSAAIAVAAAGKQIRARLMLLEQWREGQMEWKVRIAACWELLQQQQSLGEREQRLQEPRVQC